jgi:D-alanyl-D-alanine carboxypeptidase/D-alanyl-D-alanine-endopeptidase (penicillin-binding protein 4)
VVVCAALAALTMLPVPARSQGSGSAGSGSGSAESRERDPDDEGDGSGSAKVLVAPPLPAARKQWVADQVAAALAARPTLGRAKIGIAVTDLVSGEQVFAHQADAQLNLASNTKLITAIAALGTLGNGFRWRTAVLADNPPDEAGVIQGDLYLRGRGDPMLTAAHLDELAAELAARGVRSVDGRLVLDATYFDTNVEPPHFDEQPKERAGFRAPVAALGVARSAVTLIVVADPGGGASVTLEPDAGDYISIVKREVTSVTEGRTRLRVETKRPASPNRVEYEVTGQIRVGEGSWDFRRRVDDPARFAGEVFRAALAARGITVRGRQIAMGAAPPIAKQLAVHDSLPLADVVRFMNKLSDNYVAESILKTLGAETRAAAGMTGPATWADGTAAVTAYLATLGLPAGSYRATNGSGLFASTDVSAKQLVTLLVAAHADYRIGPDLLSSLPIGGADGTLARRYHGTPARGRVRAKTGTLDKVLTLAGYVAVDSKQPLAFAILLNDVPPNQRAIARAAIDDIVNILAAYLGAT